MIMAQRRYSLAKVAVVVASTVAAFAFMPTAKAAVAAPAEQQDQAVTGQDSHETVDLYGKQVDRDVAENIQKYAQENNLDLEAEFKEKPVTQDPNDIEEDRGGVEVPDGYIYNPKLGSLHDYCTKSPDQFPAPGVNADFKGACAIHDMCYEKNDGNASGMRNCDSNFRNNLITVCENVYTSGVDPRREKCIDVALVYYGAVVADHRDNYL
ncbi:phospholipase A2 [Corynebacterium durum]|uniref:phospholipase A2 n=1 Tax=Corynebacterium durum TaxID=61592 RepID=UPI0026DB274B|nr:phospholipase A2 [Corynebacterium durum]MDO4652183.1 phospholipase A2 [Corynebacterium durum]